MVFLLVNRQFLVRILSLTIMILLLLSAWLDKVHKALPSHLHVLPNPSQLFHKVHFIFPFLNIGADIVGVPFSKRIFSPASIGALIGILVAIIVMFIPLDKENPAIQRCAGVLIIMATLWISEAVPLSITALLPVVLFPILDILGGPAVASQYFNDGMFMTLLLISDFLILGWFLDVFGYGEVESPYAYCPGYYATLLGTSCYVIRYYVYCRRIIYFCK